MNELITTLITIAVALGCDPHGVHVPGAGRAEALGVDAGPHRAEPRRAVWACFSRWPTASRFCSKKASIPAHVDKVLFLIAPTISVFTTMLAFAVVPFGPVERGAVVGCGSSSRRTSTSASCSSSRSRSLAVYGVILGGWASNNKYSALGSLRASAQVVSYEIPLGMSVLGVVLLSGTLNLETDSRRSRRPAAFWSWNIWYQPLACLIFFISCAGRVEPVAVRSCRSASRNWSAATTPNTAACGW